MNREGYELGVKVGYGFYCPDCNPSRFIRMTRAQYYDEHKRQYSYYCHSRDEHPDSPWIERYDRTNPEYKEQYEQDTKCLRVIEAISGKLEDKHGTA